MPPCAPDAVLRDVSDKTILKAFSAKANARTVEQDQKKSNEMVRYTLRSLFDIDDLEFYLRSNTSQNLN